MGLAGRADSHIQCKYSLGTCNVLNGYLRFRTGQQHGLLTSANEKLASGRCGSKEVDGRQHHNWVVSRLVRRRGHLRSREARGRETACLVVGVGRVLAGNNPKPSQTAPIPCQRDIGGTASRIKQVSISLGLLGILLVETAVLTSSAADSSNTQRNTVVLSIEAREYIDVYLHVAVPPSNVPYQDRIRGR